jgi:ectoine hydroxylase-related dioxygenase (phytanoyl-CoA dioxygenase family)
LRDGYAVIPGFVEADELSGLVRAIERRLAGPQDVVLRRPHNSLLPLRWNDESVDLLLGSSRRVRLLREVLDAHDLRWLSGYVTTKEARSPALWWHQDWWCWDHPVSFERRPTQVAVLCYLTRTARENGALRVLPGSHHRSTHVHAQLPEAHAEDANGLADGHPAMADLPEQVTLGVEAGDAVVLDYRLLHGTHPNETGARRDCVHLSFLPGWSTLPDDLKAHYVSHPAQPFWGERPAAAPHVHELLPRFAGLPASLRLNRVPPQEFAAG